MVRTSSFPTASSSWAPEIALDVEWAHAIAPGASILLVEANSASMNDLITAVSTASNATGVVVVSMSWGGSEFSGEVNYDSYFTTPAGHNPVTFVASSGDSGAPASYPAASPNVLSVGGTSLTLNGGTYGSETAWSGSGGGLSSVEVQPAFQKGVVTQSSTFRATPDVSYDANPNTGVPVYDTTGSGGWAQYGGTSIAAPQWAALVALADQSRAANGLAPLNGPAQTLPMLYSMPAADFHDITAGSSSGSPKLSAGPGYDLVTGRGTPIANLLIPALAGGTIAPSATHFSITTSTTSSTAGQAVNVTVTALDGNNNVFTGYTGIVQLTSSDAAATLPAAHALTSGVYTFTGVVLDTAGSDTITATDTNNAALTGSTQETVMPAAASALAFVQQPTSTVMGAVISPAVSVELFDAFGNLVAGSYTVTLALGANTTGATLSGTTTVTASGGIASFSNLSIGTLGSYTLQVASTTAAVTAPLPTSNSFTVVAAQPATVIESFESRSLSNYYYVGYTSGKRILFKQSAMRLWRGMKKGLKLAIFHLNNSLVMSFGVSEISEWRT